MSDAHKVNEIGRWYDIPIFRNRMEKYMTKWMLTNHFDVDNQDEGEHNYFNYASDKHYVSIKHKNVYISAWHVEIAPKGREFLNRGGNNE